MDGPATPPKVVELPGCPQRSDGELGTPGVPKEHHDGRAESVSLSGSALAEDPDAALAVFYSSGGSEKDLVSWYVQGSSPAHLLRNGCQPSMLRGCLKSLVPAMASELCHEAGVDGVGAKLLAEQVVEARCDEVYHRMLAGLELDKMEISRADRLERMADRHSSRMMRSLEQLHRLKRPRVQVRIAQAGNVNLGQQLVNRSVDEDPGTPGHAG